jgi:hypothetical protein
LYMYRSGTNYDEMRLSNYNRANGVCKSGERSLQK